MIEDVISSVVFKEEFYVVLSLNKNAQHSCEEERENPHYLNFSRN